MELQFKRPYRLGLRWIKMKNKPDYCKGNEKIVRTVELFAGCGGLSLGIAEGCRRMNLRHQIELALEWDEDALQILTDNLDPKRTICGDIMDYIDGEIGAEKLTNNEKEFINNNPDIVKPDIIAGGPPCQGHSNLNNHTRRDDPRNELYLRMVRAAEILEPESIIIENVTSVTSDRRNVVHRAVEQLREMGYSVAHQVVKASEFGVPQTRSRHFLVASKSKTIEFSILEHFISDKPHSVSWAIADIQDFPGERPWFDQPVKANNTNQERMNYLIDKDVYNLPNWIRPKCHQNGHTYPAVYGRMYWEKPCPTITSGFMCNGRGRFTHPKEPRTLTPHEAARVQTFPDWFKFDTTKRTVIAKTLGNAVPPVLAMNITFTLLQIRESSRN